MESRGTTASRSSQSPRAPLGDATGRIINSSRTRSKKSVQAYHAEHNPLRSHPVPNGPPRGAPSRPQSMIPEHVPAPEISQQLPTDADHDDAEKRVSQVSTSSGASSGKRKTHIGPWQLGKTLGKGSAGRVRLARHHVTRETVAVKILPKHPSHMTQASSLADIDKWDRKQPEFQTDKRMPLSIEREVAILKLIDHPNIMKLYDIWENRSEIYLVLEYVEQGDLFEYINTVGPLREVEAVYYLRQIISALDYCHSFNICHRDLKPENLLLSGDGQIKIADFGMAAIQQSPSHRLRTACGSPHYAAPELVGRAGKGYLGATVDVWSVGVILYACLCARLPFDDKDMGKLLAKAKRGVYFEPKELSVGTKSLLRRMLTPDPEKRVTISQIWRLPLIVHYDYLDDLNGKRHCDNINAIRKHGRATKIAPEDIDMQTLRQLKSMWHMFTEKELAMKLINEESNDQKLFYWLLFNYRERRLENYVGDLTHSPSDYHHLQPANWKKKFTTLEFPSRYGRTPSRFTVISNVATDENGVETATDGGTIQSYDPYKSSRVMGEQEASHAKITVHRNVTLPKTSTGSTSVARMKSQSIRTSSTYSRRGGRTNRLVAPVGMKTSRRSSNSIRSCDSNANYRRSASIPKRGVDFSHLRRRSTGHQGAVGARIAASIAGDDTTYDRDHISPTSPYRLRRQPAVQGRGRFGTQSMINVSKAKDTYVWNDEVRQITNSVAKDCDMAFNSSPFAPKSYVQESPIGLSGMGSSIVSSSHGTRSLSMIATTTPTPTVHGSHNHKVDSQKARLWDERPLPPPPPHTKSDLQEIMVAKKQTEKHRNKVAESSSHVDRMRMHLKKLDHNGEAQNSEPNRRIVSAPIYSHYSTKWGTDAIALPSIHEGPRELSNGSQGNLRTCSDPLGGSSLEPTKSRRMTEQGSLKYLACHAKTIRMVTSPSAQRTQSPVIIPAPLNIRKHVSRTVTDYPHVRTELSSDYQQQGFHDERARKQKHEEPKNPSHQVASGPAQRKSSWFRRASKEKNDIADFISDAGRDASTEGISQIVNNASGPPQFPPTKKKSRSFAFWRSSKHQNQMKLSLADVDLDDSPSPEPFRMTSHPSRPPHRGPPGDDIATRNIEPQQSWLARLFRVKPAQDYLCFNIPRRRARQEIAILLREWRQYGMRDVQVDKDRNLVFGRVGPKNYLSMKEVSFAAEVMTVIEHGKRNPLSIVRFTQERGAASSFHKVVDTMHAVFSVRNLLVVDKHKIKMMIKTLNY